MSKLEEKSYILDFGCGFGHDTRYFLEHRYCVYAVDSSKELCSFASEYTEIKVENMLFQELEEINKYDGV